MSHVELNPDFQWGKKRGPRTGTDAQFYESFTYDGVEYFLFDCVYMWREEQGEPDVGVVVKMYETSNSAKKVKVVWFFRPSDIKNFLGNDKPMKKELFLASGEGKGLTNLNDLFAISGKCNIVCKSKNRGNLQASDEESKMADFFFYRTFDVGARMLSEIFPDRIAGIRVEYFFNKIKEQIAVSDSSFKQKSEDRSEKEPSYHKWVINEKVGNGAVRRQSSSHLASTENQPSKKRKLATDFNVSSLKQPPNVCAMEHGEGSSANIIQTAGNDFKGILTELSEPLPGLLGSKAEATEAKTSSIQDKGIFMEVTKKRCNISHKSSFLPELDEENTHTISHRPSCLPAMDKNVKPDNQFFEITIKSNTDTNKWFKQLPWEERMKSAHEQGTLVFFDNLDPTYTSSEVEDIVWQALNEKVSVKTIEHSTCSSPQSGQAFVIFKSKVAAETTIYNLNKRCLILSNGRPLIAYTRAPTEPDKASKLVGHLDLDRVRLRKHQKEWREAVWTSHCSQPNNIEYDLALQWCRLHGKTDAVWNALHKKQAFGMGELKSQLKCIRVIPRAS